MAIGGGVLKKSLKHFLSGTEDHSSKQSEPKQRQEQILQERMVKQLLTGVQKQKEIRAEQELKQQQEKEAQKQKEANERKKQIEIFETELAKQFKYRPLAKLKEIAQEEYTRILLSARKPDHESNSIDRYDLARCYFNEIHGKRSKDNSKQREKNLKKTIEWLEQSNQMAPNGYAPAQYNLAIMLIKGLGVRPDPNNHKRAFELLTQAASVGYIPAHTKLGYCYLKNIGVELSFKNLESAYHWYKGARKYGDLKAEEGIELCLTYFRLYGIIPEQDLDGDNSMNDDERDFEAFQHYSFTPEKYETKSELNALYKQAHDNPTDGKAQYYYAYYLQKGNFTTKNKEKDLDKMFRYFKIAAEKGFPPAQYQLFLCYRKQLGIPNKDKEDSLTLAMFWCKKAAEAGYAKAQYELAIAYEINGKAQRNIKTMEEAFLWFMRAAVGGIKGAQDRVVEFLKINAAIPHAFKNPFIGNLDPAAAPARAAAAAARPAAAVPAPSSSAASAVTAPNSAAERKQSKEQPYQTTSATKKILKRTRSNESLKVEKPSQKNSSNSSDKDVEMTDASKNQTEEELKTNKEQENLPKPKRLKT